MVDQPPPLFPRWDKILPAYLRPKMGFKPSATALAQIRRQFVEYPKLLCLGCRGMNEDVGTLLRRVDELEALLAACEESKTDELPALPMPPTAELPEPKPRAEDPDSFTVGVPAPAQTPTPPPQAIDRDGIAFWNAALDTAVRCVDSETAKLRGRATHLIIEAIRLRLQGHRRT